MSTTVYPHIELNAQGTPVLAGTVTKVVEVALDRIAHHWDADEIRRQHPHLSLAQIYAALAYYYDHQVELDQDIERQIEDVDDLRSRIGESPLKQKLRSLGRLP